MIERKVSAYAAAAAAATIVVATISWVSGSDAPAGLEGALATVLGFVAGYMRRV